MKYIRVDRYILSLDGIHGILNHEIPSGILGSIVKKHQIIVTYLSGTQCCLDFLLKEDADKAFEKIASVLESL